MKYADVQRWVILALVPLVVAVTLHAQVERKDKGLFVEPKSEFMDSMRAALKRPEEKAPKKKVFRLDFSTIKAPTSTDEFTKFWHTQPVSQGISGMCWCFSRTSLMESEIYRLSKREIKLSELYTVYWEYVEKARGYVQTRGKSVFGEGSQSNAVPRIWREYGVVPSSAYTGLIDGQKYHDHEGMFAEMNNYLKSVKNSNSWNEEEVVSTVKSIMNHYIGEPPTSVIVEGKVLTPKEYLEKVVRLNLDDYVEIMSIMQQPYYQYVEYEVPDNWWHNKEYFNVPLDDYMAVIKSAIRKGCTMAIFGDTSEPGYEGHAGVGVIPTFDIPSAFIDESSRQARFSNGTTGDDHGIHIIGYTQKEGKDWYLIKDSGSGSRNNSHPGYYFYHEDYVKLKIMGFTVHKDVVRDLLEKQQK